MRLIPVLVIYCCLNGLVSAVSAAAYFQEYISLTEAFSTAAVVNILSLVISCILLYHHYKIEKEEVQQEEYYQAAE